MQFHRRYLNWYWHSLTPSLAPFATSLTISGWDWHSSACLPARRFAFLQMVLGSITSGLPTALEKLRKKNDVTAEDRASLSEPWREKVCFLWLLSNTCCVHHSVNSVAEVISSHKPEGFLCLWWACQPYPPLLSCDDNVFFEQARGRGQSAHFPWGILALTSDSQACIWLLDGSQEKCVVLHEAGIQHLEVFDQTGRWQGNLKAALFSV